MRHLHFVSHYNTAKYVLQLTINFEDSLGGGVESPNPLPSGYASGLVYSCYIVRDNRLIVFCLFSCSGSNFCCKLHDIFCLQSGISIAVNSKHRLQNAIKLRIYSYARTMAMRIHSLSSN